MINGFGMLNVRSEGLWLASVCPVFKPCVNNGFLLVRKSPLQCTDPDTPFLSSSAATAEPRGSQCGCWGDKGSLVEAGYGDQPAVRQAVLADVQKKVLAGDQKFMVRFWKRCEQES